ncbi:MAG: Gfo/Idh/MocA family oxidoreductase, partial [Gemmataceae bacterium]|nr:Gfo/Idh/MocA family oxidoreductase [Gemmataceae bacterium]
MALRITRRHALGATAAGLGYLYLAPAASAARIQGANAKLRCGGIGVGGKGSSDIDQAGNLMDVVALCDVDDGKLAPKAKKWPEAKTFSDFRKLFDDTALLKNIDAFTISTPDHTHALAAVLAMRAGKHVYVQKPLTHDVYEAHLLMKEAKKNKVCTQMGNQGTAANGLRRAAELLRAGELGDVAEVHVWTNRPIWPQAPQVTDKNPPKKADVPKGVNWDAFLGPAPEREYAAGIHPFAWRGFWDYGTGAIGDMACHTANMLFMGLNLATVHPTKVSAEAGDVNPLSCPSYAHVTVEFPKRDKMVPVTLHWYEGKKDGKKVLPPEALIEQALKAAGAAKLVESGSIVVGTKGIAYSPDDYGASVFFTTGQKTGGGTKPETMPSNNKGDQGQKDEWVEAIKANKPELALSNFSYASMLTAAFLLGNVAIRTGKAFAFDGEKCAADVKEAAALIRREYRKGWDLIG